MRDFLFWTRLGLRSNAFSHENDVRTFNSFVSLMKYIFYVPIIYEIIT